MWRQSFISHVMNLLRPWSFREKDWKRWFNCRVVSALVRMSAFLLSLVWQRAGKKRRRQESQQKIFRHVWTMKDSTCWPWSSSRCFLIARNCWQINGCRCRYGELNLEDLHPPFRKMLPFNRLNLPQKERRKSPFTTIFSGIYVCQFEGVQTFLVMGQPPLLWLFKNMIWLFSATYPLRVAWCKEIPPKLARGCRRK